MENCTVAVTLFVLGFAFGCNYYFTYEYVHVNIDKGTLRGCRSTTWRKTPYFTFRGVPYAKPPLGKLRFKSPQEESAWAGVRDAVSHGELCPQVVIHTFGIVIGEEDCLLLNIYTPSLTAERLPVLVWFHGGAFEVGSSTDLFYGPDYFIDASVILVTLNYRLGALGYLSSGDEGAPGNAGLKDQVAALHWVRRNIQKFGGDPKNVTIAGESAGAACVHYHLISPLSAGLFARAIVQSASALNGWTFSRDGPITTIQLAENLGATNINGNVARALEFLEVAPYKDIVRTQGNLLVELEMGNNDANFFLPTVEKGIGREKMFLPESPLKILQSGDFNKVPCIIGYTSHEGYLFVNAIKKSETRDITTEFIEHFIPNDIRNKKFRTDLAKSIRKFYFDDKPVSPGNISNLVNFYSDVTFTVGIDRAVKLQLQSTITPIYYYVFSYGGGLNFLKYVFNINLPGASHGDDLGYLFYLPILFWQKPAINSEDEYVLDTMVGLWTNFAKYGDPTPPGNSLSWKPVTLNQLNYLNISGRGTKNEINPDFDRIHFWAEAYDKYKALEY